MSFLGSEGTGIAQDEQVRCEPNSSTCIPASDTNPLSAAVERILDFLAQTGIPLISWLTFMIGLTVVGGMIVRITRERSEGSGEGGGQNLGYVYPYPSTARAFTDVLYRR